jgi:methylmalonyl-CoA mutase N-terminal domain/subunit
MAQNEDKVIPYDRNFGALIRDKTQSNIPVKPVYGPQDTGDLDYKEDIGEPGQFPFTRGIYPEMYRKNLWLKSFIVCYATPHETNRAFKKYIAAGQTGLRVLTDTSTLSGVDPDHPLAKFDPDHPLAKYDIMCNGNPTFALTEYETMLDGISMENIDFESANSTPSGSFFTYVFLMALMENRGYDTSKLRGTNINDPIHAYIVYGTPEFPPDLAKKINLDLIDFGVNNTPKWHPCTPCGYDMRDAGINSIQEMAFVMGNAIQYYGDAIKERGVFSMSSESDFFETIAKFRATRRLWAKIAKERLGATNPRNMACRIGIRTAGNSIYPQKPLNNTARITMQILAAVLGGVQSIDPSGIDETFGLPSEESRIFELDLADHIMWNRSQTNWKPRQKAC